MLTVTKEDPFRELRLDNPLKGDIECIKQQLSISGVAMCVEQYVLDKITTSRPSVRGVLEAVDIDSQNLIANSSIVTVAADSRKRFLESIPLSEDGDKFTESCLRLAADRGSSHARLMPKDGDSLELLRKSLVFSKPSHGDAFEVDVLGNLTALPQEIERLLIRAGIQSQETRTHAYQAIASRIALIMRALACESANIIITCRVRNESHPSQHCEVHYDGPFLPSNQETKRVEYKALFALTPPATLLWSEDSVDRRTFIEAQGDPKLKAQLAPYHRAQELAVGEVLVFKTGDPEQALIHAVPGYPACMNRLLVQINPLDYVSLGEVWLHDQKLRVRRALTDLSH